MWYHRTNSTTDHHWLLFLIAFLAGILACQLLLGDETTTSQTTGKRSITSPAQTEGDLLPTSSKTLSPGEKQTRFQPLNLGGPDGFGNGKAIGSGVATLEIHPTFSDRTSDPQTNYQSQPIKLATAETEPLRLLPSSATSQFRPLKEKPIVKDNLPSENSDDDCHPMVPDCMTPAPMAIGSMATLPENPIDFSRYDGPRHSELLFNGGDQGKQVMVDSSFNIYNLDVEDTIGHFDTLDGQRLIATSNRVAIYAPRFGSVRRVDGLIKSETRQRVAAVDERLGISESQGKDFSSLTKQHVGFERYDGSTRPSGFVDQNRGVVASNFLPLVSFRNVFEAYENFSLIRWGKHLKSESARLGLSMQAANVWQDNLGLQVAVDGVKPVIVNDTYKVQQFVQVDSDDRQAVMRVVKVANKISARPGEEIEFTIRFDNLSSRRIGNVTIVDHLTGKLEYVADSAECSLTGDFIVEDNDNGSLILKWEITDPMPANTGGLIRFRCRVK